MLIRQAGPQLRPGAYLIGAAPEAATLTYAQLERLLSSLITSFETA
jgi:hypothetical protein